jgi:hypothetical protein
VFSLKKKGKKKSPQLKTTGVCQDGWKWDWRVFLEEEEEEVL